MRVSEPYFAQSPWVSPGSYVTWYLPLVLFSSSLEAEDVH